MSAHRTAWWAVGFGLLCGLGLVHPSNVRADTRLALIEVGVGYSYADLIQFDDSNFIPSADRLSGSGYGGHLAIALQVAIFTVGARATLSRFSEFDLGTAVLDVAFRPPALLFHPYVRAGLGASWVGAADFREPSSSDTTVFGLVAELGAGVDFQIDPVWAVGAGVDGAFLNLSRQRADRCGDTGESDCMIDTIRFDEDGDAVGLQVRGHIHATLSF